MEERDQNSKKAETWRREAEILSRLTLWREGRNFQPMQHGVREEAELQPKG